MPIGETLGAGDEKADENVLDSLVVTLGRAGFVLRQLRPLPCARGNHFRSAGCVVWHRKWDDRRFRGVHCAWGQAWPRSEGGSSRGSQ